MEESASSLNEYIAVLGRRKRPLLGSALVILAASLAVAFGLPAVYRSTATILIEQQEIPVDMVRSTVTSYADERVQQINRRVMTSANLLEIMNKHDLYSDKGSQGSIEMAVERMKDEIQLDIVRASVIDPRSGRPTNATIAFTIGYENSSPRVAQLVANELASLYLNENLKTRRHLAAETSGFLADEAEKLKVQLVALERDLAEFKENNVGQLPELVELNMQLMDRMERELREVERQMRAQEQNRIHLRSQLAQLSPMSGTQTGTGKIGSPDDVRTRLAAARVDLAGARENYSKDHPDVKRFSRIVANLEVEWERVQTGGYASVGTPDDPAYIETKARLNAANVELRTLRSKQQELGVKLSTYEDRLTKTPQIEREYRILTRDHENALKKYQEVKGKQLEAQFAESLEVEGKGERFTLIEPPQLPEAPVRPNRLAIAFLGLVLSVAGGIGAAAVAEAVDPGVHGMKQVARLLGEPPLAAIPLIEISSRKFGSALRACLVAVLLISGTLLGAVLVHEFVLPLDVIWLALINRIGI